MKGGAFLIDIFSTTLHSDDLVFLTQKVEAFRTATLEDISIIAITIIPLSLEHQKEWRAIIKYREKKL